MPRPLLAVMAALLLLSGATSRAQDQPFNRLSDYFEALRVQAGIPGLAAIVVGPTDILWERAFGWQDTERSIAARTDTPFHLDGLTQMVTATLVLRCVEEGRLSLGDRVGQYKPSSPDANATLAQILTHTSGTAADPVFVYRPERLEPLTRAIRACTDNSYRETVSTLLEQLAMIDSVPGQDIIHPETLTEGIPSQPAIERYGRVLQRLAVPYAVDRNREAFRSEYVATTLLPGSGLIATARDLARFDLALKLGVLLGPQALAEIRRVPVGANGVSLPHGLGWFVQSYNGETVVWQFGVGTNSSSSFFVSVPARGITMILLANSDGLVKPFNLAEGNLTASPFARLFLGLTVR